jgi:dTDP-4-amino-4,6-dideoxygalactose transaminase
MSAAAGIVPFNKPHLTGDEVRYIHSAVELGHTSGNGSFTKRCHRFFSERYGFKRCLLTSSCTDALEMCGILLDLAPGDEVIVPSYTFVSTANAFALRGARLRFADSKLDSPNVDPASIEALIGPSTKAVVVVHYAGIACDMGEILRLVKQHNLILIEDCAHSIDSFYDGKPLGSFGTFATFSFHETKNVICGEGGLLVVNDERFWKRAEMVWEKGTNRAAFARGEVQKYLWLDLGSSFLTSDIVAAFLLAQLEHLEDIQRVRITLWEQYQKRLSALEKKGALSLLPVPSYATVNGHLFAVVTRNAKERDALMEHLSSRSVNTVFHYLPLHASPFAEQRYGKPDQLVNAERFASCLLRLPFFYDLGMQRLERVCREIESFYGSSGNRVGANEY